MASAADVAGGMPVADAAPGKVEDNTEAATIGEKATVGEAATDGEAAPMCAEPCRADPPEEESAEVRCKAPQPEPPPVAAISASPHGGAGLPGTATEIDLEVEAPPPPRAPRNSGGTSSGGGILCELAVKDALEEYFRFHGFQESLGALRAEADRIRWNRAAGTSPNDGRVGAGDDGLTIAADIGGLPIGGELVVARALSDFDAGRRESLFQVWRWLVPVAEAQSPIGFGLELRLRVHFGTLRVRLALAAAKAASKSAAGASPEAGKAGAAADGTGGAEIKLDVEPDFEDLKAFLGAHRTTTLEESGESLAPLFSLPFVPQPYMRPGLKFVFEKEWLHKLRADLCTFLMEQASARHAPTLKHLAGNMVLARGPKASPPPASWHELLAIADQGLAAAACGRGADAKGGPVDRKPNVDLLREVCAARKRLAEIMANPDMPSQPAIASIASGALGPGGSDPELSPRVCRERLWPISRESELRAESASKVLRSNSPMSPKRLHSARSLESRARTATALLPVPPGLDFARITAVIAGKAEEVRTADGQVVAPASLHGILRAVLRRLALPEEPLRPRRAFLAAFACFGALRTLAGRLTDIVAGSDATLTELALAAIAVCACETVGRREIEAAETQGNGYVAALLLVLRREPVLSRIHMHCLAVLQRLSLRRKLQSKMIELGAIDWILHTISGTARTDSTASCHVLGPAGVPNVPDFSAEFTSALLMNLTLRHAGRRRCGELGGVGVLVELIEHPNPQVRTHVNGTLYTLLGVPSLRAEAVRSNTEAIFQTALARAPPVDDDPLKRQLEYLLLQLRRDVEAHDGTEEDEDSDGDMGVDADADDGDNFLDEEELAAHFLLASAPVADDLPLFEGELAESEAEEAAAAAAAEAAAVEEVLRPFRASPAVADAQQRRFHAFIARNCRSLISPKRRNSAGVGPEALLGPLSPGHAASPSPSAPSPPLGAGDAAAPPVQAAEALPPGNASPTVAQRADAARAPQQGSSSNASDQKAAVGDAGPKGKKVERKGAWKGVVADGAANGGAVEVNSGKGMTPNAAAKEVPSSSATEPGPQANAIATPSPPDDASAKHARPPVSMPAAQASAASQAPRRRGLRDSSENDGQQKPPQSATPPNPSQNRKRVSGASPKLKPKPGAQGSSTNQTAGDNAQKGRGRGRPLRSGGPVEGSPGRTRSGSRDDSSRGHPPGGGAWRAPENAGDNRNASLPPLGSRVRSRSEAPRRHNGGEGLPKAEAAAALVEASVSAGASSQGTRWRQPQGGQRSDASRGSTSPAPTSNTGRGGGGGGGMVGPPKNVVGGTSSLPQLPRIAQQRR